jgi:hypothetical protein
MIFYFDTYIIYGKSRQNFEIFQNPHHRNKLFSIFVANIRFYGMINGEIKQGYRETWKSVGFPNLKNSRFFIDKKTFEHEREDTYRRIDQNQIERRLQVNDMAGKTGTLRFEQFFQVAEKEPY